MNHLEIREARQDDLHGLLALYTQLHGNPLPAFDDALEALWQEILGNRNHHVLLGLIDGVIVSSCVLVITPNLTRGQRPYALIENVVTDEAHRGNGYATALLDYAGGIAEGRRCYKIMLLTGSKQESTLRFYERAGYNRNDKTGFIRWLDAVPARAEHARDPNAPVSSPPAR